MPTYIGKYQVDNGEVALIGSTLYGICVTPAATATKVVTLANFDSTTHGVTIHVKFVSGNSVLMGVTLTVGNTNAYPVTGNCLCNENEIVAFTLEQSGDAIMWRADRSITIESANNIVTKISGQDVNLATKTYVDNATAGIGTLTGAMMFRGKSSTQVTNGGTENPIIEGTVLVDKTPGDVVLYNKQEYVWNGSQWQLFGDEGSYALKSKTTDISEAITWTTGEVPQLGIDIEADDIIDWQAGSASSATVSNGVLRLVNSTTPTLRHEARSIPNIISTGTLPTLTVAPTTVVVP